MVEVEAGRLGESVAVGSRGHEENGATGERCATNQVDNGWQKAKFKRFRRNRLDGLNKKASLIDCCNLTFSCSN